MTSAPLVLYLGCWLAGRSGVWGELPAPGPSISVRPGGVIAPGRTITIRCRCQCGARRIFLYKDETEIQQRDADKDGAKFTIPSAGLADEGVYTCRSRSGSEPPDWSSPSHTMRIIVGELRYLKPSISLHPSGGVALGGAVTVRCRGRQQNARFLLYKDGNLTALRDVEPAGDLAEFPIRSLSWRDAGSYRCYYQHQGHDPFSQPSDPVELVVPEPKLTISLYPSEEVVLGGTVTVRCECRCPGAMVLLSKAGDPAPGLATDSVGDVVEFPIHNLSRGHAGTYNCRYSTKRNPEVWSEPSDPVELVVAGGDDPDEPQQPDPPTTEPAGGGTDPTQPGTTPAPTHPGSAGPGTRAGGRKSPSTSPGTGGTDPTQLGTTPAPTRPGSEGPGTGAGVRKSPSTSPGTGGSGTSAAPVLTLPIIAGVSAAAAGLLFLLLLLAFACYRRTCGRKGPVPGQSSGSEAAATVYAFMGERKQVDVPEPDPEGLTYAELDGRALQAKRGGAGPRPRAPPAQRVRRHQREPGGPAVRAPQPWGTGPQVQQTHPPAGVAPENSASREDLGGMLPCPPL